MSTNLNLITLFKKNQLSICNKKLYEFHFTQLPENVEERVRISVKIQTVYRKEITGQMPQSK
jgi:hypothetical protein